MHDHEYKQHTGLLSKWVDGIRTRKIARWIRSGEKVLDVGCGSALLLNEIPAACSYVGIDRDSDVIEKNRRRFPRATFQKVDVCTERLPFADDHFDVIAMGAFLEHVENAGSFFVEMTRVLKPGGKLVATTPSASGMWVHEILSSIHLLSHDAAEEHKGAFTSEAWTPILQKTDLKMIKDEKFEMGLNQLFILQRGHS